jgi:hypothetical protein
MIGRSRRAAMGGAALGVALALLLPAARGRSEVALPISGPLVDEAEGALTRVAFHFAPDAEPLLAAPLGAFLSTLDPGVQLEAVVPPARAGVDPRERLRKFLAALPGGAALVARTRIVVASGDVSPWSKDRALVARSEDDGRAELLVPARPGGAGARRAADWRAPLELAAAAPADLSARVLPLDFDAGDLVVTGGRVLVDPELLEKNAGRGLDRPATLAAELSRLLRAPVTVLGERPGDLPRHHLSMVLTPLGGGAVLLGDPRWGERLVGAAFTPGEASPETGRPLVADFSAATLARYDRAAQALAEAGYRVVRIPTVAFDEKTYLAYTNGVFETRGGRRIAWIPVFDLPRLDAAAVAVYASQGFEVRRIPARALFPFHGTIGCLVNVLARKLSSSEQGATRRHLSLSGCATLERGPRRPEHPLHLLAYGCDPR